MKRVPMLIPAAPIDSTATRLRPSALPPEATNGIFNSSAARGSRIMFGMSSSPGMATTFEPVDADGVATELLCFQGMPHGRAFVDHLDLSRLQRWHVLLRTAARRLHDFYAPFLDGGDVFAIGRLRETRQEREIHPKWLVRHVATARDFLRQEFRRLLCKSGDDTEPPGAGYRRGELGKADVVHAHLDDRMPDAEQFSDRC